MLCFLQASYANYDETINSPNLSNVFHHFIERLNILEARNKFQEESIVALKKELSEYKAKVTELQQEVSEHSDLISMLPGNASRCSPAKCSSHDKLLNKGKLIHTFDINPINLKKSI